MSSVLPLLCSFSEDALFVIVLFLSDLILPGLFSSSASYTTGILLLLTEYQELLFSRPLPKVGFCGQLGLGAGTRAAKQRT
jgi:hypothetical protein